MNLEYYIHLGRAKCGSSTLQKHLFDKHSNISYYGIYPSNNIGLDNKFTNIDNVFLNSSDLRAFWNSIVINEIFDEEYSRKLINSVFEKFPPKTDKIVLSNERLSSVFFSLPDINEKIFRLKKIFPNAKFFFIERDVIDVLKSQYRDHPFDPSDFLNGKPFNFNDWVLELFKIDSEIPYLSSFKEGFISKNFSETNFSIFYFNDWLNNLNKFCLDISSFLGIDYDESFILLKGAHENSGVSARFNFLRKYFRKFNLTFLKYLIPDRIISFLKKGKKSILILDKDIEMKVRNFINV